MILALLVTTAPCLPVSAAEAQIFYNAKLDTRMQSALETYKKGRDEHLAILARRADELGVLELDLRRAIVARSMALRDADAAALLDLNAKTGETLGRLIDARLSALLGETAPPSLTDRQLAAIGGDDFEPIRRLALAVDDTEVESVRNDVRSLLANQKIGDGSPLPAGGWSPEWFCALRARAHGEPFSIAAFTGFADHVLAPALKLDPDAARRLNANLEGPCALLSQFGVRPGDLGADMPAALRFLLEPGQAVSDPAFPAWAAGIGRAPDAVMRISAAIRETEQVESEQKPLNEGVSAINAEMERLKNENAPVTTAQIEANAKRLADLIDQASGKGSEQGADETGDAPPKFSLENAVDFAEQLGLDGSELDKLNESRLVKFIGFLADPRGRKAQLADCTSTDPTKRKDALDYCVTDQLLAAIDQLDYLQLAQRGVPGKIAAAMVELARAKALSDINKARGRSLAVRLRNLDAQRRAILTEVALLYRAKATLGAGTRMDQAGLARSLFFWTQARNAGDLPYQLAVGSYTFIRLNELSEREQIVIASRYALLDDLFATLASYAGGGLKPAEAAAILSAFGVTAIGIKEVSQ